MMFVSEKWHADERYAWGPPWHEHCAVCRVGMFVHQLCGSPATPPP